MKVDLDSPRGKEASERSFNVFLVLCTILQIGHLVSSASWAILAVVVLASIAYGFFSSQASTDRLSLVMLTACMVGAFFMLANGMYTPVLASIFLPLAVAIFFFFAEYWRTQDRST